MLLGALVGLVVGHLRRGAHECVRRWSLRGARRIDRVRDGHRRVHRHHVRAAGRRRPRDHRRLSHLDGAHGRRHRTDRHRRRRAQGPVLSRPRPSKPARRRSSGYRNGCRPGSGPSGTRLAGRGAGEPRGLGPGRSGRARQDPAQPGQGRCRRGRRGVPRARRARSGSSARASVRSPGRRGRSRMSMLPEEVDKTLRKLGDDGDKVRGAARTRLRRVCQEGQQDRGSCGRCSCLTVARPLLSAATNAATSALFRTDDEGFQARLRADPGRATQRQTWRRSEDAEWQRPGDRGAARAADVRPTPPTSARTATDP